MRTPVDTDTFYGPHRVWLYLSPFCGHPEGSSKAEYGIWVKSSRDYSIENCQVGRLCFQCSCFKKWLKLKTWGWGFELSVASVIWKSGNYLRDNLLCRWWRFCLVLGERFPMARKNKLELTMDRFWDTFTGQFEPRDQAFLRVVYHLSDNLSCRFRPFFKTLFKVNVSNGGEK